MKKYWYVGLINAWSVFFLPLVQAGPVLMNSPTISLGTINGDVVNGVLMIERQLNNPILLSVIQDELDAPVRILSINQAKLIKNQKGDVVVNLASPVKNGMMEILLTFEVWLDGKKTEISLDTQGHNVQLKIDRPFHLLEVRVPKPLQMQLPNDYRGSFDFSFDIEVTA